MRDCLGTQEREQDDLPQLLAARLLVVVKVTFFPCRQFNKGEAILLIISLLFLILSLGKKI